MPLWMLEYWKPALTVCSLVLSYPFYRVVRRIVRISRTALALEVCQEDLRITTDRMNRQKVHLDAYGIDLSLPLKDHQTSSSPPNELTSTPPPMN